MKTKIALRQTATPAKGKPNGLAPLVAELRSLIRSARRGVASAVDSFQVMTNLEIGRRIVEHEQKGKTRAAYGAELLKELSAQLTKEFGKGFSRSNLEYMRKFFLIWQERVPVISQQPIGKSDQAAEGQQVADELLSSRFPHSLFGNFLSPSVGLITSSSSPSRTPTNAASTKLKPPPKAGRCRNSSARKPPAFMNASP